MTFSQTFNSWHPRGDRLGDTATCDCDSDSESYHSINHTQTHHTTMPYFTSSEEWQRQSALLLQARPNTVHLFPLTLPSHLTNDTLTDAHNNKIPHPLGHLHIPQTLYNHRRHRRLNKNPTNRSPRAQNLRSRIRNNAKIPYRQSCRGGEIDCCNGNAGKGNGCVARGQGGCGYGGCGWFARGECRGAGAGAGAVATAAGYGGQEEEEGQEVRLC
jgi:hypothetical protein